MFFPDLPRPVVLIVGPTAVGKTEIALALAERLGGEIVSADSRLLYRGMDIGTAKPTPAELRRVPHHLIDVADPDDVWGLATYQRRAREAIEDIHARRRLPFVVGGTGQYVRALIESWEIPAQEPDHRLRDVLEAWGKEIGPHALHRKLRLLDPLAAERIDPFNVRRTIRALEVTLLSGRRFSAQGKKSQSPYSLLQIGLERPRAELYARIDARIQAMFDAGLVDEVRGLLAQGFAPTLPTLSAIGYQEIAAYLQGQMTLDEAVTQMKRLTRVFVRRQANWFSAKDPAIHWFTPGLETVGEIEVLIRSADGWITPGLTVR